MTIDSIDNHAPCPPTGETPAKRVKGAAFRTRRSDSVRSCVTYFSSLIYGTGLPLSSFTTRKIVRPLTLSGAPLTRGALADR